MTIRVERDISFMSGLYFEGQFMINFYDMKVIMNVNTDSTREQNIAIQRIFWFIENYLQDCVFVSAEETEVIQKYEDAGISVCVIPEEPYDQIVGMILLNKLNAIMEGRLHITEIVFGSKLSNMMRFITTDEEAIAMFPEAKWYNDPSVDIKDKPKSKMKKDKIVKLFEPDEWEILELTWKEKKN